MNDDITWHISKSNKREDLNYDFLNNEDIMRMKYEQRNQEIINYFKDTNKLLILDFEESQNWDNLCDFLKKPIPSQNFPHLNKTK